MQMEESLTELLLNVCIVLYCVYRKYTNSQQKSPIWAHFGLSRAGTDPPPTPGAGQIQHGWEVAYLAGTF